MDACNLPTAPEPLDGDAPASLDTPAVPPLAKPAPDFPAAVRRLAALPLQGYEACRKAEARALGVRPAVLDGEVWL